MMMRRSRGGDRIVIDEPRTARRVHRRAPTGRQSPIVAVLVVWIVIDVTGCSRALEDLEARGITRRSEAVNEARR